MSCEYVYIIRQGATHRYKVGFTKDPKQRLRTLQTGNADPLHLVCAIQAPECVKARDAEQTVHDYLKTKRAPGGGTEWFVLLPHEVTMIQRCLSKALQPESDAQRLAREIPDAPTTPPSRAPPSAATKSAFNATQ